MSPGNTAENKSIMSGIVKIDNTCDTSASSAAGCVSTPYGAGANTAVSPTGIAITQIPESKKVGVINEFCGINANIKMNNAGHNANLTKESTYNRHFLTNSKRLIFATIIPVKIIAKGDIHAPHDDTTSVANDGI